MLVAALALALSQSSHAVEIVGRVVHVADGDMITVLDPCKKWYLEAGACPLSTRSGRSLRAEEKPHP